MLEELSPGESVDFIHQGQDDDLGKRFLEVLKEAWQKLPAPARKTILQYYQKRNNGWYARVILGARIGAVSPIAMGGGKEDGFMAWFDSLAILDMPGKEAWAIVVIGEELAHAFLLASQDPTHTLDPPNKDKKSPEYQTWYNAREEAATKTLFQWPFDPAIHAQVVAWLKTKEAKPS
jgi:hypothetical protein